MYSWVWSIHDMKDSIILHMSSMVQLDQNAKKSWKQISSVVCACTCTCTCTLFLIAHVRYLSSYVWFPNLFLLKYVYIYHIIESIGEFYVSYAKVNRVDGSNRDHFFDATTNLHTWFHSIRANACACEYVSTCNTTSVLISIDWHKTCHCDETFNSWGSLKISPTIPI